MARLGDRAAGPDAVAGGEPAAGEKPAGGEEPAETQWPGIATASPIVVKVGSSSLTTTRGGIDEDRIAALADALAARTRRKPAHQLEMLNSILNSFTVVARQGKCQAK